MNSKKHMFGIKPAALPALNMIQSPNFKSKIPNIYNLRLYLRKYM